MRSVNRFMAGLLLWLLISRAHVLAGPPGGLLARPSRDARLRVRTPRPPPHPDPGGGCAGLLILLVVSAAAKVRN